jgi:hypothetical protein
MTRTTNRYLTGIITGLLALSLASCASNAQKPSSAANEASAEKSDKKDPGPAALGYKIMNNKGEPLYCKQIRPTGSNVARTTRCMTAKEWQNTHDNEQRTLEELRRGHDYPK